MSLYCINFMVKNSHPLKYTSSQISNCHVQNYAMNCSLFHSFCFLELVSLCKCKEMAQWKKIRNQMRMSSLKQMKICKVQMIFLMENLKKLKTF